MLRWLMGNLPYSLVTLSSFDRGGRESVGVVGGDVSKAKIDEVADGWR